jgi:hypothetical protein
MLRYLNIFRAVRTCLNRAQEAGNCGLIMHVIVVKSCWLHCR